MITDLSPQVTNNAAYRMLLLLQAIEDKETSLAAVQREYKNEIKNLHDELNTLRRDIMTGQLSLVDAMEVTHPEPMSQENQNR